MQRLQQCCSLRLPCVIVVLAAVTACGDAGDPTRARFEHAGQTVSTQAGDTVAPDFTASAAGERDSEAHEARPSGARLELVETLTTAEGGSAIGELSIAIFDDDPEVRAAAAHALGELATLDAIGVLQPALIDSSPLVRQAAIEACADIGGAAAAQALITALEDQVPSLRGEVVDALADIGGDMAIAGLNQALADPHPIVRESAAEALRELR